MGAQGFSQAVNLFIRLAEVPLLLTFWGVQLYGEWLMLAAIPAYLAISDGGFATTACRDMAMKSSAGDRDGTLAVFQSTWLLLLVVSLVGLLIACSVVAFAPVSSWLGFSAMSAVETQIVLLLLVIHVLIGFQGGLLNGGFWVAGRYPTGMALSAITQLLEFFCLGLAVILGGSPIYAALGYVTGRILGTCLMWLGQQRVSPWLKYGIDHASRSELRRLMGPAFSSLAFPLGNALNIQGMRLVVGLALGPAAVAVFSPLRTLSRLAMMPKQVINQIVEPELALAHGQSDKQLFNRLFLKSCQLSFWGCLFTALLVLGAAHWVFIVWTGGKVLMQWPVFLLLIAGALVNSIWNTALMVPYATNRHTRIAIKFVFIYGAAAFAGGYLASNLWGLNGAALNLLVAELLMTIIVVRVALQMTETKSLLWLKSIARPPWNIIHQSFAGYPSERNG